MTLLRDVGKFSKDVEGASPARVIKPKRHIHAVVLWHLRSTVGSARSVRYRNLAGCRQSL